MTKTGKRVLFAVIALVFIIGIVFATIYDYDISASIGTKAEVESPVWTRFFDVLGEAPGLILAAFGLSVVIEYFKRKEEQKSRGFLIGLGKILLFISGAYPAYKLMKTLTLYGIISFDSSLMKYGVYAAACIIIGLAIAWFFALRAKTFSTEKIMNYKTAAFVCLGIEVCVLVICNVFKFGYGRPRPWDVFGLGAEYSAWYVPHLFSGYRSFPSGHTSNATVIMMLAIYFPKKRKWMIPLLSVWVAIIATSRLFAGAHFLTDIIFGIITTLLICYIWCAKTGAWGSVK